MELLQELLLLSEKDLIAPNELDKKSKEMKYPNVYDKKNRGIGAKTKISTQTIIARNTKTGQVYGRRSIAQK